MDTLSPNRLIEELVKTVSDLKLTVQRLQSLVDEDEVKLRMIEETLRDIQRIEIVAGRNDDSENFFDEVKIGMVGDGGVVTSNKTAIIADLSNEAFNAAVEFVNARATIDSSNSVCMQAFNEDVNEQKSFAHRAVDDRKRDFFSVLNKALAFGKRALATVGRIVGFVGSVASVVQPEFAPLTVGVESLLSAASGMVSLGEQISKAVHPIKAAHGYGETANALLTNPSFTQPQKVILAKALDMMWAAHLGTIGDLDGKLVVDGSATYPTLTAYTNKMVSYITISERGVQSQLPSLSTIDYVTICITKYGSGVTIAAVPFYERLDATPSYSGISAMHVRQIKALIESFGTLNVALSFDSAYKEVLTFLEHGTRLSFLSDIDASIPFLTQPNSSMNFSPEAQVALSNARSIIGL